MQKKGKNKQNNQPNKQKNNITTLYKTLDLKT